MCTPMHLLLLCKTLDGFCNLSVGLISTSIMLPHKLLKEKKKICLVLQLYPLLLFYIKILPLFAINNVAMPLSRDIQFDKKLSCRTLR